MRKSKIVNRQEVSKHQPELVEHIRDRVIGVGKEILTEVKTSFEEDLTDIGLLVIKAIMDYEIDEIAGSKGRHNTQRIYTRWGSNPGSVILNGKKVFTPIPRVVDSATKKAYQLKSHSVFQKTSELVKRAYRDLIRGISSRHYQDGVTKFLRGYGTSASAVSRHMVEATAEKVRELMERSLRDLDLCVLMLDGIQFGGHTVIIALAGC
jgi:putative transposase